MRSKKQTDQNGPPAGPSSPTPVTVPADVNFSIQPETVLSTPSLSDDIVTTHEKMEALVRVIEQGKSLAVHTAYRETPQPDRDPVEIARANMKPYEREQYDAWSGGFQLPPFDWKNNVTELPPGTKSSKRFATKAEAMNIIWKTDQATPQHAAWVVSELPAILPLINAVGRVEAAKRNLVGGIKELDAMELAELQTIHRVISTASRNAERYLKETRTAIGDINRLKTAMQSRASRIKNKLDNSKPREPRLFTVNNNATTTTPSTEGNSSARDTDPSPGKDESFPQSLLSIPDLEKVQGFKIPGLVTPENSSTTHIKETTESSVLKGTKRGIQNQQVGKEAKIKLSGPETNVVDIKKDATISSSSDVSSSNDNSSSDDTSSDDSSSDDSSSDDSSDDSSSDDSDSDSSDDSSDDSSKGPDEEKKT